MTEQWMPGDKAELMSAMKREWKLLIDVAEKLSDEQMTKPDSGGWSPKDNLAHLAEWMNILNEFSTSAIDYTGLDAFRAIGWQRQLHLFEVPFYYIEYGIAQLGAIGLWMQYKQNPQHALQHYMNALSLGGTKTLPELYKAAGLEFNLTPDYIKKLMEFVKTEMDEL